MRDPGVQPERTALAWRRTGLAMLANGLLLARGAAGASSWPLTCVAALVLLASAATIAVGSLRRKALLDGTGWRAPNELQVRIAATGAVLTCAAALAVVS